MSAGADSTTPLLVRVPAPLYVLFFIGVAEGIFRSGLVGASRFAVPALGMTCVGLSIIIAQWAIGLFALLKTSILPGAEKNMALVENGPYRFTRNPMYLSLLLGGAGIALMVGHWPLYLVPVASFVTFALIFIPHEEAQLERQFGERYRAYRMKVRRWL